MKGWWKKDIITSSCRKIAILMTMILIIFPINGCSNSDPGTINVWLFGNPSADYYYLKVNLSEDGRLEVYRTELSFPTDIELPEVNVQRSEEVMKYCSEHAMESGRVELNEEQVKELRKFAYDLVDNFDKRAPLVSSGHFGIIEIQYKGEWYHFIYRDQDEFITKLVELSPIPIETREGFPLLSWEEVYRREAAQRGEEGLYDEIIGK